MSTTDTEIAYCMKQVRELQAKRPVQGSEEALSLKFWKMRIDRLKWAKRRPLAGEPFPGEARYCQVLDSILTPPPEMGGRAPARAAAPASPAPAPPRPRSTTPHPLAQKRAGAATYPR